RLRDDELHHLRIDASEPQRAPVEVRLDQAAACPAAVEQFADHAADDPLATRVEARVEREAGHQLAPGHRAGIHQHRARAVARGRYRRGHAGAAAADHHDVVVLAMNAAAHSYLPGSRYARHRATHFS